MYVAWKIMVARIVLSLSFWCISFYCSGQIALYENILCAEYASLTDQIDAEQYYQKVLSQTISPAAVCTYCTHLYRQKKYGKLIEFSQKYPHLFTPINEICGYLLALVYQATNNAQAIPLLKELARNYPGNIEIIFHALHIYVDECLYEEALAMIKKLYASNRQAKLHYVFNFIAYQAHYALHNYMDAKKNLERALLLQPKFEQGWLLISMFEERLGNIEKAKLGYEHVFDLTGDTLIAQKLMKLKNNTQTSDVTILRARQEISSKNFKIAQKILDTICLKKMNHEQETELALLQLDIFMAQKKYGMAHTFICKQLQNSPREIWLKIGHLFYLQVPDNRIKLKFRNFLLQNAKQKNDMIMLLYVFDLFLRSEKLTLSHEAHIVYGLADNILALCKENKLMQEILFQVMYYAWKRKDMQKIDQLVLYDFVHDATHIPLINLLAYYYAGKGKSPYIASKYIRKIPTSEFSKDVSLRDTRAFILYKSGEYEAALQSLKGLEVLEQNDTTLLRHYGKICARAKKIHEAQRAIKKAIMLEIDLNKKKKLTRLLVTLH